MRVLVLTMLYPSPTAPHQAGFMPGRLKALAAHGDLAVVVPYPTVPPRSLLRERCATGVIVDGYRLYRQPFGALPGVGRNRRAITITRAVHALVTRLHAEQPFEVVLGHFLYPDGVAAAAVARRLGLPYVLVAHGSDVHQHAAVPARRRQIAEAVAGAGAVIAVSEPLRQRMLALGLAAEQAVILPCGYEPEAFAPREREPLRRAFGLDGPWLLFVGMLRRIKRVDVILDALARLPEVRLAVVGDGEERAALTRQAERLGLGERVRWLGPRPHAEVADWMAAADAVVLASDHEGTPTVLVEAMALGTPVVATRVGGIPDLVGELARLAPPDDPAALAAAVAATLAAPAPADSLRERVAPLAWPRIGAAEAAILENVIQLARIR